MQCWCWHHSVHSTSCLGLMKDISSPLRLGWNNFQSWMDKFNSDCFMSVINESSFHIQKSSFLKQSSYLQSQGIFCLILLDLSLPPLLWPFILTVAILSANYSSPPMDIPPLKSLPSTSKLSIKTLSALLSTRTMPPGVAAFVSSFKALICSS